MKAASSTPTALVGLSYSISSAIQVTGFSRSRLYKLISDGELDTFKVGGRTYISHAALSSLIARAEQGELANAG